MYPTEPKLDVSLSQLQIPSRPSLQHQWTQGEMNREEDKVERDSGSTLIWLKMSYLLKLRKHIRPGEHVSKAPPRALEGVRGRKST